MNAPHVEEFFTLQETVAAAVGTGRLCGLGLAAAGEPGVLSAFPHLPAG